MTDRFYQFCDKHPGEPLVACDLCVHETRLATREECAHITQKMDLYRDAILGPRKKNGQDEDENIP